MSKLPTLLVPGSLRLSGKVSPEVPIEYITAWLRHHMTEYGGRDATAASRVLIVRAETGSGKSTVMPVAIFRILRARDTAARLRYSGPGVLCVQPKVLTSIALATDVSAERIINGHKTRINPDMVLGETVGFQTGPVSNCPPSGLVFATAGVLAAQLRSMADADFMTLYRFIIVDEAHERSLEGDMVLMLLRDLLRRNLGNTRLPCILLASATFDTARYADYFGLGPANVVEVVGRSYPIDIHWPATGTNDYPAEAAAVALRIHAEHPDDPPDKADVLVFVPGAAETTTVVTALVKASKKYADAIAAGVASPRPFIVLTVNREVVISQTGDYPLVFVRPDLLPDVGGLRPARRIIVSTTVAETGLTIDTLRYVIDNGWSRTREVYQPEGAEGLITRPAPRSRIKQRMGRVGRLFPGDAFPLYTESTFKALEEQQLPDIVSRGVSEIYLALVQAQQRQKLRTGVAPEFRVEDVGLLDPPAPEAFLAANATATALGYVSARAPLPRAWPPAEFVDAVAEAPGDAPADALALRRGYGLTALGSLAAAFPRATMEATRVLLAGLAWGAAASDLLTAVAMFGSAPADLLAGRGRTRRGATPTALPPGAEALRAAVPPFLAARARAGGGAAPLPPTDSEAFYFRTRLLLADDFAEGVLVFDAFALRLDAARGDLAAVSAWCEAVGLDFEAMLELARKREGLAEEMIVAGLNPFRLAARRLSVLGVADFTEGLRALKRCLYDGLRCRLLRLDDATGAYVTSAGLRVAAPPLFTDAAAARLRALRVTPGPGDDARPRWLVTDAVRLRPAPRRPGDTAAPLLYVTETGLVSVLDGYVDPDPDFDAPRTFAAS